MQICTQVLHSSFGFWRDRLQSFCVACWKCLRYNKNTITKRLYITTKTKTNSMTGPPQVLVVWGKVFEDLPSPAWSILGDSWPTFHCLRATILQFILEFLSFLCLRCILLHISTSIFQFPSDIVQLFRCLHASPSWPGGSNSSSRVRGSPFNCAIHTGSNFPPHYCMIWVLSIQWM